MSLKVLQNILIAYAHYQCDLCVPRGSMRSLDIAVIPSIELSAVCWQYPHVIWHVIENALSWSTEIFGCVQILFLKNFVFMKLAFWLIFSCESVCQIQLESLSSCPDGWFFHAVRMQEHKLQGLGRNMNR